MDDLDFSEFFITKIEAIDFLARLSTISGNIYRTDFDLEKALIEQFGVRKKDKFNTLLRDSGIPLNSSSALKNFLSDIQEKVSSFPIVTLKLAFEPGEETLRNLYDWFPLNINKQILLDIEVDSSIIAGAQINYGGKSLDCSIRPIFDQTYNEMLTNNKNNL
jgi:hypothetical protein